LWAFGALVVSEVRYRSVVPYQQMDGYQDAIQRCGDNRIDLLPIGEISFGPPTRLELRACLSRAQRKFHGFEDDRKRRLLISALKWSLIPALLLLVFSAFYEAIFAGLRSAWRISFPD